MKPDQRPWEHSAPGTDISGRCPDRDRIVGRCAAGIARDIRDFGVEIVCTLSQGRGGNVDEAVADVARRQDDCTAQRAGAVEQLHLIAGCGVRAAQTDTNGRGRVVGAAAIRHDPRYREYVIGHLADDRYAWRNRIDDQYAGGIGNRAGEVSVVPCSVPDSRAVEIECRDGEVRGILASQNRIAEYQAIAAGPARIGRHSTVIQCQRRRPTRAVDRHGLTESDRQRDNFARVQVAVAAGNARSGGCDRGYSRRHRVDCDSLAAQGRSAAGRSICQADGISSVGQRSPSVIEAPAAALLPGIGGDRPNQRSLAAIAGAVDATGYPNPERADAALRTAEYQGVVIGYEISHRSTIRRDCGERGLVLGGQYAAVARHPPSGQRRRYCFLSRADVELPSAAKRLRSNGSRRRANLRARRRFQGLEECRTARARSRLATPEQQLAILTERPPNRAQIGSMSSEAFQRERTGAEAHLTNPSVGNNMDCIESVPAPYQARDLAQTRLVIREEDRVEFRPEAGEQRLEIVHIPVDEGDLS